jgi:catabolite regulation protein CreA
MGRVDQGKKNVTRFGSITSPGGAIIAISDPLGAIPMIAQILLDSMRMDGAKITKTHKEQAMIFAEKQVRRMFDRCRVRGFPKKIGKLFRMKTKKDTRTYCKELTITGAEFQHMVICSDLIGFRHKRKNRQFLPKSIKIDPSEFTEIDKRGKSVLFKKATQMFKERKVVVAHLFENLPEWHCFYFTYSDSFGAWPTRKPHWTEGHHVHYVSHLWGNVEIDTVWKAFDSRDIKVSSPLHIKFVEK